MMFEKFLAQTGGSGHRFISSFPGEEWRSQSRGGLSYSPPGIGERGPRQPPEALEPWRRRVIRKVTRGEMVKQVCWSWMTFLHCHLLDFSVVFRNEIFSTKKGPVFLLGHLPNAKLRQQPWQLLQRIEVNVLFYTKEETGCETKPCCK